MKNILIINGPNLNLLGTREPEIYGSQSFDDFLNTLKVNSPSNNLSYFQSNVEGEIINKLHEANNKGVDGVILNAAGYTHTSVAIGDAVAGISTPVVEVHISNVLDREDYRHVSFISKHAVGVLFGFGLDGYRLALHYFSHRD